MKLTSATDSIYLAAVDDEDDFREEAPPEEISPLVERGRGDRGWTPPKENPFEWQRTFLHGIHPELRHDNGNRQLIHVVGMPDGTFATHQILSPDAPTNHQVIDSRGKNHNPRWRVNRFFHDENGQLIPFTDEDGNTVFSESTDHPNAQEAGSQYLSNREWDKFRSAGWARPSRNEMRYTKLLEGDPKIMLHAELVNTAGNEDLERPESWSLEHFDEDRGISGRTNEAWKVSAYRMRRNLNARDPRDPSMRDDEDPYEYEHLGTRYHPDVENAIAGTNGRKTLRGY